MNLYGYAAGDPVNYSDPMGLLPGTLFSGRPSAVDRVAIAVRAEHARRLAGDQQAPVDEAAEWAAANGHTGTLNLLAFVDAVLTTLEHAIFGEGCGEGVQCGSPGAFGPRPGFNNFRTLNKFRIGSYRVSVDAEIGGSGLGQVHVHLDGVKYGLASRGDLGALPGSIRSNPVLLRAINRAFNQLDRMGK